MNIPRTRPGIVAMALIAALAIGLVAPGATLAGCLTEFNDCGDCAHKLLFEALRNLRFGDAADAYVYGLDCEIDLVHCLAFAHHHTYECSV